MGVGKRIALLLGVLLVLLVAIGVVTFHVTSRLLDTLPWVTHTHEVLRELDTLISLLKDAETGERGYLLTGQDVYLQPYVQARSAIEPTLAELRQFTADNASQQRRLDALKPLVSAKFKELQQTIEARKEPGGAEQALAAFRNDRGKRIMDDIRRLVEEMADEEKTLLSLRTVAAVSEARRAGLLVGVAVVLAVLLVLPAGLLATRSITRTLREAGGRSEVLEQELSQARRERDQATERGRMLELVCQSLGRPLPETAPREEPIRPAAVPQARAPVPLPGQLGQYRLLEKLGEGGMGAVYKALHTRLKRAVAVKVLTPGLLHDERALARFHREMEAVGKLDHPNIVRASDAGEDAGWHFLVMELVEGMDLARLSGRLGPLPVAETCEAARQAAAALQHAHEHGLVHRDVKPSNLLLTPAGEVKVLDLGLARLYGDQPVSEVLTATGVVMGTPDYMAPEQAFEPKSVDIRADVYSLGCTLYKLLAGRPPFGGPSYETLAQKLLAHAQEPVPPIRDGRPDVPEGLAAVLGRLLAKRPADRYATPAEVAAALGPFASKADLAGLYATAARGRQPSNAIVTKDYQPGEPG